MGCTASNYGPWRGTGLTEQKCEYRDNKGQIYYYTILKGEMKHEKHRRALRRALEGVHVILRSPLIGRGYLCDANCSNTWKWDPGKCESMDTIFATLMKGRAVFLIPDS